MRTSGRAKTQKRSYKHVRINKKKSNKTKASSNWDWSDDVSNLFLDNINDVIRQNKTRRAEGRGCWKIMPRDSCEVYKDRRRRLETRRKFKDDRMSDDTSFCSESQMDEEDRRRPAKRNPKRRVPPKKVSKAKHKRRYTTSRSSSYTTSTSMTSGSDM
ncbi:uncharacterized protein LOC124644055 isoform X1 [Helicoverpa zea]|uniref:Uncharacterized protein n=1 Tax=Helicoverpa armigera TaxID=29058 RepID=A0A2W1BG92_HELAM|nr:uncharacterized protein LOC124644055 isoform X1 [Helicoverpa zea]PZC72217.1 hypothetical protein B5X24_HaOG211742 [Helicoverpa armigera]